MFVVFFFNYLEIKRKTIFYLEWNIKVKPLPNILFARRHRIYARLFIGQLTLNCPLCHIRHTKYKKS